MILTSTLTDDDVKAIVDRVSVDEYDGNLTCGPYSMMIGYPRLVKRMKRDGRIRLSFCLRGHTGRGPGCRTSYSGRRTAAASWQAHRDVMKAIFEADPNAHLATSIATYNGKDDFLEKFPDTYWHNVGSQMFPLYIGQAES